MLYARLVDLRTVADTFGQSVSLVRVCPHTSFWFAQVSGFEDGGSYVR